MKLQINESPELREIRKEASALQKSITQLGKYFVKLQSKIDKLSNEQKKNCGTIVISINKEDV